MGFPNRQNKNGEKRVILAAAFGVLKKRGVGQTGILHDVKWSVVSARVCGQLVLSLASNTTFTVPVHVSASLTCVDKKEQGDVVRL